MPACVAMVGRLPPALVATPQEQYAAPELDELDPQAAERVEVVVTSGGWGGRPPRATAGC